MKTVTESRSHGVTDYRREGIKPEHVRQHDQFNQIIIRTNVTFRLVEMFNDKSDRLARVPIAHVKINPVTNDTNSDQCQQLAGLLAHSSYSR